MGTSEDRLKEYILTKYKSVREFTGAIDMPYSTVDSIFKRGIRNASVENIIKICEFLGISTDALIKGYIERKSSEPTTIAAHLDADDLTEAEMEDVANYISYVKSKRKK